LRHYCRRHYFAADSFHYAFDATPDFIDSRRHDDLMLLLMIMPPATFDYAAHTPPRRQTPPLFMPPCCRHCIRFDIFAAATPPLRAMRDFRHVTLSPLSYDEALLFARRCWRR
jgi:hypothetical protein